MTKRIPPRYIIATPADRDGTLLGPEPSSSGAPGALTGDALRWFQQHDRDQLSELLNGRDVRRGVRER